MLEEKETQLLLEQQLIAQEIKKVQEEKDEIQKEEQERIYPRNTNELFKMGTSFYKKIVKMVLSDIQTQEIVEN